MASSMDMHTPYHGPELWGGLECTINRVGDNFRDQLEDTGHYLRVDDIDQFAKLGIKSIRYPVLWEHHCTSTDATIDWHWTNQQLKRLEQHRIKPIVSFLHHGSGPSFTNLLDEKFPELLAEFATTVIEKFPELEYFTPVNEPLTTARFSGLYGFWYPHKSDDASFLKMLLNEMKGVVLSMQAIRKINPKAKLVQTEDLAKIHSTETLQYQADFENHRRWLTFDILCGKLNAQHPLWKYFLNSGISKADLQFFIDNPCPPDFIGLDYYVTSERFLDDRIGRYPNLPVGGNGRHQYVDIEAVRVKRADGFNVLLREAWERFHLPIAITEVYLSCTREEQMRWFKEIWEYCSAAKKNGVDVRAVTAWALLGSCDWDSLITKKDNRYESGVYDARHQPLRRTAVTKIISAIGKGEAYNHPVLENKGWWHNQGKSSNASHPLVIIGKNGALGQALAIACSIRNIHFISLTRSELDITNLQSVESMVDKLKPWGIINAAGYVNVDQAEEESQLCYLSNSSGPHILARVCQSKGIQLLTYSTDLVFNGDKSTPYEAHDRVRPLNHYGKSKALAESVVGSVNPSALIIRSSAFFGPWDRRNFVDRILQALDIEGTCMAAGDIIVSPTYLPDLAHASLDLFIDEEKGIWHLANEGNISWWDFAQLVAERAGHKQQNVIRKNVSEMNWKALRPPYSALKSSNGFRLPDLEKAVNIFFEQRKIKKH